MSRWSVITAEVLGNAAARGLTPAQLADEMGVRVQVVWNACGRHKVRLGRAGAPRGGSARAIAVELYREGMTVAGIAQEAGLSAQTVVFHLRSAGIEPPPGRTFLTREVIEDAAARGLSPAQLADELGVNVQSVWRACKSAGLRLGQTGHGQDVREIVTRLRGEGLTVAGIAEQAGVTHQTVSRHLRAAGLARPYPADRKAVSDDGEAVRMYAAGATVTDIARHFGVSWQAANNALKRAGVPKREPAHKARRTVIIRLWKAGHSSAAIAAKLGISSSSVRNHLNAAGLVTPGRSKHEQGLQSQHRV